MRKNFYIPLSIIIIVLTTYFLGYWFPNAEKITDRENYDLLIKQMEEKLGTIIENPYCSYGINHQPQYGTQPECGNLMFWLENDKLLALHSARSDDLNYWFTNGLDVDYLQKEMQKFYEKKGFIIDQKNTRVEAVWSEEYKKHTYAFIKDDLKCYWIIPSINAQGLSDINPIFITMACGKITDQDRQIYNDYLKIAQSFGGGHEPFWLQKIEGDFAELSVGSVSSVTFLLKRVNGIWTAPLGPRQEYAMCADVDRLGFPKSIYQNCMLEDYSLREPIE